MTCHRDCFVTMFLAMTLFQCGTGYSLPVFPYLPRGAATFLSLWDVLKHLCTFAIFA